MTNQEIIDGNVLIAKTIGFQEGFWYSVEKPVTGDKKQFCKWDKENSFFGNRAYPREALSFHVDWNWLMQAVEYVEGHGGDENEFDIFGNCVQAGDKEFFGKAKIEAVWKAVVDWCYTIQLSNKINKYKKITKSILDEVPEETSKHLQKELKTLIRNTKKFDLSVVINSAKDCATCEYWDICDVDRINKCHNIY